MRNFKKLRKLILLFRSYGISLIGQNKFKDFHYQLNMDKIYVYGLIFEVEFLLKKEISCNWEELNNPHEVIQQALVD